MSAIYTLLLRSDDRHSRPAERDGLIGHLLRIPGAVEVGPDRYRFGDEDEHGVMELDVFVQRDGRRVDPADVRDDEAGHVHEMEVRIPRPWVMERGPQVFALVFMLSEWAKWEVFDTQIGQTLQKEAVLSGLVAMRQQQRDAEEKAAQDAPSEQAVRDVPDYRPSSPAPERKDGDAGKRRRPWWKLKG